MRRTLAAELAAGLMERIISTPFEQIVGNFDGYTESQGSVKDASGTVFTSPSYAKLSIAASCQYVCVPQETPESCTLQPHKFICATVSVYYDGRQMASVSRLITK